MMGSSWPWKRQFHTPDNAIMLLLALLLSDINSSYIQFSDINSYNQFKDSAIKNVIGIARGRIFKPSLLEEIFKDSLSDKEICGDRYEEEIYKVGSKNDFTLCEAQVILRRGLIGSRCPLFQHYNYI